MKTFVGRYGRCMTTFGQDERGVTAIEFGMVGLPFILLITAIVVIGFLLFAQSSLDYATHKAARQIMVGNVQTSALTADQFRTQTLCPMLPASFSCGDVIVSLQTVPASPPSSYYAYVNTNLTGLIVPPLSNAQTAFCPGGSSQYKLLEVMYTLPVYLSLLANSAQIVNYNGKSAFLVMSTAAFKNEPFNNGNYAPPAGC